MRTIHTEAQHMLAIYGVTQLIGGELSARATFSDAVKGAPKPPWETYQIGAPISWAARTPDWAAPSITKSVEVCSPAK